MATTNFGYAPTLEMLHQVAKDPSFRRASLARPLSSATEIFDDFESDYEESLNDSSRRSTASWLTDSVTTVSTPRDGQTPDLSTFQFHIDDRPVMGPSGPHLFRPYMSSDEFSATYEVDFVLEKTPTAPLYSKRNDTPIPDLATFAESEPQTHIKSINAAVSALDETKVRSWSPPDVVRWMQEAGFDDSVVEQFLVNDISGAILLDLQPEDLKELDIRSFGKRRNLMNSIQRLRDSITAPQPSVPNKPRTRDQSPDCQTSSDCASTRDDGHSKKHRRRNHRPHKKETGSNTKDLVPDDTASIVAIEQVLPRPHHCSKGEDCRKWQKQQRKIARLAKDLPIDIAAATFLFDPEYKHQPPMTAKSLPNTEPMPTPSIVASSDVLGPERTPNFNLSELKFSQKYPRDPQENIRQYLDLQHFSRVQPVDQQIFTKPKFGSSPEEVDSPDSTRTAAPLGEHLRTLPRLTIPVNDPNAVPNIHSASLSAQRTVTPSILRREPDFSHASMNASKNQQPFIYDEYASPSDFYRSHELYQQASPLSEVNVPVTAIPACPIEREASQSVPPDMRFGNNLGAIVNHISRPTSTYTWNSLRERSSFSSSIQALDRVDEAVQPIDSIEDLHSSQGSSERHPDGITHSGWMKKRKTTRMLRHEWEPHHFTLRGTQLAMHEDEEASSRDSKALEYIDVDDYAVACSSFASYSKLTAAFKKTVLKRNNSAQDETAFAFSLLPASHGSLSGAERKNFFTSSGKSHHFAVQTRDERIDWMRELMLAKALKREKDNGNSIHVNGNFF